MKTTLDCIPCFVRQALDSIRMVTDDEAVHERLLREVLRSISEMDMRQSPPEMGRYIHSLIRKLTRNDDPYREKKDQFNRLCLKIHPELEKLVADSPRPLETAIRLTIAGNVIDFGVNSHVDESTVHEAIDHALTASFDGEIDLFTEAVSNADEILYLADNAGEIVFDKLLLERLPLDKVTVAVKGSPIINDATMEDAEVAGITDIVEVIDNGSDAPGTILQDCSEIFRRRFDRADLVIAKGQGNYETLNDVKKDIFFILKAKCPVIADDIGCPVGSLVMQRSKLR